MKTILGKLHSQLASTEEEKRESVTEESKCENNDVQASVSTSTDTTPVNKTATSKESPKRNAIRVCKMGSDHIFANMNNQDFAFNLLNMKIVMDGCGSGKHSEVGAKIFGQLLARKAKEYLNNGESICEENFIKIVNNIFNKMIDFCGDTTFIFQNYCFTILVCFELEDEFVVYSCGDGYIIKENEEGIAFDRLDDGEYPSYYIYNFITDKSELVAYQDGVSFKVTRFKKTDYFNVGVASDGLRFCENLLDVEKNKLMKFLHEGKGPQIEVLINRNNRKNEMFHDDISICF